MKFDCGNKSSKIDETKIKGVKTIESLLQEPFDKHIGTFEIPYSLKGILDADHINAIVTWYLKWKFTEPVKTQTTCTIINVFGYRGGTIAIIAINVYKYLRNQGYDHKVVERFLNKQ